MRGHALQQGLRHPLLRRAARSERTSITVLGCRKARAVQLCVTHKVEVSNQQEGERAAMLRNTLQQRAIQEALALSGRVVPVRVGQHHRVPRPGEAAQLQAPISRGCHLVQLERGNGGGAEQQNRHPCPVLGICCVGSRKECWGMRESGRLGCLPHPQADLCR
jgi:hypothetical protein